MIRAIKKVFQACAIAAWTATAAFGGWYAHELYNTAQPYVSTMQRFYELNKQVPAWGAK